MATLTSLFCTITSKAAVKLASRSVMTCIQANPGLRLFEIDRATLRSYNTWGAKSILLDLEQSGRIYVKRQHHGKKVAPTYYPIH